MKWPLLGFCMRLVLRRFVLSSLVVGAVSVVLVMVVGSLVVVIFLGGSAFGEFGFGFGLGFGFGFGPE